jgi:hypothetical protein
MNSQMMVDEMIHLLDKILDHEALSRFLEPHLPLIKMRVLNHLYLDLRYHKGMYGEYIPILINESNYDYRLKALLCKFLTVLEKTLERE